MATCANCLHHSLCDYNTNISGNGKVRLVYSEGADVKCSFFENTADVVPKSEVERLEREKAEMLVSKETDVLISMEKLVKVRTEHPIFKAIEEKVAREIFEEIKKKISSMHYNAKTTRKTVKVEELKEQVDWVLHEVIPNAIAEIEKKYTEGER